MTGTDESLRAAAEQGRILAEHRRRDREVDVRVYAPWNPAAIQSRAVRTRAAALLLARLGVFPKAGEPCIEIGFGSLGWLAELLAWGLRGSDLHGVELDASRAAEAQARFPGSDLRVGDATRLPWPAGYFRLAVASTLFTSILDPEVRKLVAVEIVRVLAPGGALLWYDFRVNNPSNPNVRKVGRKELMRLFPGLAGEIRSTTLAPPIARAVAPISRLAAELLESIPLLRTHLVAVLVKGEP